MHSCDLFLLPYLQKYPSILEHLQLEISWAAVVGTGFGCHNHRGWGKLQPVYLVQLDQGEMVALCPVLACTWQRKSQHEQGNLGVLIPSAHPHHLYLSAASKILFNNHCCVCPVGFKSHSKPTGTFGHEFHPSIIHCMNQNFFFPFNFNSYVMSNSE